MRTHIRAQHRGGQRRSFLSLASGKTPDKSQQPASTASRNNSVAGARAYGSLPETIRLVYFSLKLKCILRSLNLYQKNNIMHEDEKLMHEDEKLPSDTKCYSSIVTSSHSYLISCVSLKPPRHQRGRVRAIVGELPPLTADFQRSGRG